MTDVLFTPIRLNELEALIQKSVERAIKTHQPQQIEQTDHSDKLLTVQEAAEFLHLTSATIYSKVSRNELPVCKTSGSKRLYFSLAELTDYVKSGRKLTNAEIEQQADQYLTNKRRGA